MVDYIPINRLEMMIFITLLSILLSFYGPSEYNSGMFEKLCRETHIPIELPTLYRYIIGAHIAK